MKAWEGIGPVLIEVLPRHIPKGTERDCGILAGIAEEIRMGEASPKHRHVRAPICQPTQTGQSIKYVYVKIDLRTPHKLQGNVVSCEILRC